MPDNAANTDKGAVQSDAESTGQDQTAGRDWRQEIRLQCDPASVLLELAGYPEPVEGQVVDVSKCGLHLRMGAPARAGESVHVTSNVAIIRGQIRYCRANDAGSFDAGVQILDFQYTNRSVCQYEL